MRAGVLKSEDYKLLKEIGFDIIQTGIESFSKNYLKKMNKGTRVIDNIAVLKFCRENNIVNEYNLLVNFPNEEPIDFEETKKIIKMFKQYLDPPQICYLRVVFKSPIYDNINEFNIEKLESSHVDKIMFPDNILENNFDFVFSYESKKTNIDFDWEKLIDNWKIEREMIIREGLKSKIPVDQLIFYFIDGGNFIKIYDKRNYNNIQIFNLDEIEREIFLSCIDIISFKELKEKLSHISEKLLTSTLETFEDCDIVFREDDRYLSLPLNYKKISNRAFRKENEETCFVYNSGNHLSL